MGAGELQLQFRPEEAEQIAKRFGQDFLATVEQRGKTLSKDWGLSEVELIPSYSANLVLRCQAERYGPSVLKLAPSRSAELRTELQALRSYEGTRFCRLYEADLENGALLIEAIQPGTPLREVGRLEERIQAFCSVYEGLHRPPVSDEVYPTYLDWVTRIAAYMTREAAGSPLQQAICRAEELCRELSLRYSRPLLLHGDLHHDNLLLDRAGEYRIIDPKGVVGDPIWDLPRFLLNELEDEPSDEVYVRMNRAISLLENRLGVPEPVLRKCLYVETAMGFSWCVEDGADADEQRRLAEMMAFCEAICFPGAASNP
ncbi:aminoglycoside phosphotransferase family protein [Gorillibacterium sp. CAU 1737]|uniref:aminoglycoside phosphotransferase family protein n=1 Tax=Gorillibacterium sp. CAU 1737 TaxID=3140362 RepID=UPI003261084F